MLRRKRAEVHVNQERWLVSYADFITLLFAFFVVMYSISQVNQSKYRVLSDTFVHAFSSPSQSLINQSQQSVEVLVDTTLNPIQVGDPSRSTATSVIDLRSSETGEVQSDSNELDSDEFVEISGLFAERFGDLIDDKLVRVASNELWLQIELKDSILFTSGNADPSLQAQAIFDEIALILKDYPNPVQVEGYTDNVPIKSPRFPSNWELSSARASAIVKWLATKGVEPTRLSAVGFGEFQPVAENTTAEGRAQNRRVVLMIARKSLPRPGMPFEQSQSSLDITPEKGAEAGLVSGENISSDDELTISSSSAGILEQESSSSVSPIDVPVDEGTAETVTPIELDDGGLLFTSDPNLPRNSR
jgi:chemotaxis protein MotB